MGFFILSPNFHKDCTHSQTNKAPNSTSVFLFTKRFSTDTFDFSYYNVCMKKKQKEQALEKWLLERGDRTIYDLEKDEQGKWYVYMWSGIIHTNVRVYLPKELQ